MDCAYDGDTYVSMYSTYEVDQCVQYSIDALRIGGEDGNGIPLNIAITMLPGEEGSASSVHY
jgi:hypothetical protein